ncbi:hypothetical protein [Synechococcus sp. BA-132 BA5]|uniref:hypothetical protein n=1 Tax=Synechococcus sp. BA-132 BA5 TaxID=3110252 RepID=UPI002B21FFEE|nr:hypothetical protein [Synechococcus sp. BA-132 BA5]MEA5417029.1 hypothetical protein [Synechococcus sp. BA-132 BA5]
MAHALVFVLAPEGALPADGVAWADLLAAQRLGIGSGVALRMFRAAAPSDQSLDDLVASGQATVSGADPFEPLRRSPCPEDSSAPSRQTDSPRRLICDALVPHLEPRFLWLGAYELSGPELQGRTGHPADCLAVESIRCLDQFSLKEADNETCWFYPTENGDYLCWENRRSLELSPGYPADPCIQQDRIPYERRDLRLLWSLMADDQALTCVGLTYQRRRIEWPVTASDPEPFATWTSFRVDSMADDNYREISSITVFPD